MIGYNNTDDQPLGCANTSFRADVEPGQMSFYCNAFWDGTSGGPWITNSSPRTGTGVLIGDIGGYHTGGDYAWQSYSDYYTWPVLQLFAQAL